MLINRVQRVWEETQRGETERGKEKKKRRGRESDGMQKATGQPGGGVGGGQTARGLSQGSVWHWPCQPACSPLSLWVCLLSSATLSLSPYIYCDQKLPLSLCFCFHYFIFIHLINVSYPVKISVRHWEAFNDLTNLIYLRTFSSAGRESQTDSQLQHGKYGNIKQWRWQHHKIQRACICGCVVYAVSN